MTRTFIDAQGIERAIDINPVTLDGVHERFQVRLMDLFSSPELVDQISNNAPLLMQIVAHLSMPLLSDEEAVRALLNEQVMSDAVDALLQSLEDYLPDMLKKAFSRLLSPSLPVLELL